MNWEALGAVAELLGAIGVIVTLIYLSRQISHNSKQLEGSSTIAAHNYFRTLLKSYAQIQVCGLQLGKQIWIGYHYQRMKDQ